MSVACCGATLCTLFAHLFLFVRLCVQLFEALKHVLNREQKRKQKEEAASAALMPSKAAPAVGSASMLATPASAAASSAPPAKPRMGLSLSQDASGKPRPLMASHIAKKR